MTFLSRPLLALFYTCTALWSAHVEPDDAYLKHNSGEGLEVIAAKGYAAEIPSVEAYMQQVIHNYEASFGYRLDDTLYLTLASSKNQIANAFSTQIPLNMQVDYIGGSLDPDYFAATSWLQTILLHESAHNYQLNAKANPLTRAVHRVVKNTPVTWLIFAPVFPVPNLIESSFLLEGNAVLNESRFGNGGRLYSGALLAMTQTQAKADYLTPARLFNDHLFFPYNTHHYIVGGYFQLFLAERYGVDRVNRYFYAYSRQWLPFFTNSVFKAHFGKDFETLIAEFRIWMQAKGEGVHTTKGEVIARSKAPVDLSRIGTKIAFLTTDAKSAPQLYELDTATGQYVVTQTTHQRGKLFRIGDRYYTRTSARTAPDAVTIGLFDEEREILPQSASRVVECVLPDNRMLYLNVNRSYLEPQLFLDGKFLAHVNSSVICRGQDYYYFRQNGKKRTLYHNKEALYTYRGYFGKVVDVDESGRVLFVANTEKGSTLYRYENDSIMRLCEGDDILDARILTDKSALVSTIGADGITVQKIMLHPQKSDVYETRHFFEQDEKPIPWRADLSENTVDSKPYSAPQNLHYSALNQYFEITDDNKVNFNLRAYFSDPLERNHFYGYLSRFDEETKLGVGYDNSATTIGFGTDIYTLLEYDKKDGNNRGFGLNGYLNYPLLASGYRRSAFALNYHLDAKRDAKSPLALSLFWQERRQFGFSLYPDYMQRYNFFITDDRDDIAFGAAWRSTYRIGEELYLALGLDYAKSDSESAGKNERGILVDNSDFAAFSDPARLVMPSLKNDLYVKEAAAGTLSLAKTLNYNRYYFSFPLSLRRELLYGKYRRFYLKNRSHIDINEYTLGMQAELLLLHRVVLPVSFEWMHNDTIKESRSFRLIFNLPY